jgi:enamine deaminase RidA (YjgF/YER057c/UK114 family)
VAHDILDIKTVHPTKGYSHAARAGNLLFIAGQVAKDRDDKLVGLGDAAAQARQIYRNLAAVLGEAGGSLSDIVKMTTYLTHSGYVETYRTVRNEFFTDPMPPNTLVICESLATPEFLMEVEAIAVVG